MDETREDLAIAFLGRTTPMTDPGRRRLALRLFLRVTTMSDRFRHLVLDMAHHHLRCDNRRLLIDQKRTPGVIDLVDLQLLRKLVFGAGGQYADQVDPVTASFLLKLDRAPFSFAEPKAWKRLFLQALSLCLLRDREGEAGAGTIDETAAASLIQSIEAGGTGANTAALLELLSNKTSGLPPALEALAAKK
jgi:hypothetical protein